MKNKDTTLLFASYQARKTKEQKTAFIQHASSVAANAGFMSNVENTKNGARNIVVGDINSASVVYTAHYDTPSKSPIPSFILPKLPFVTTLYQIALGLFALVPSVLAFILSVWVLPLTTLSMSICVLVGIVLAVAAFIFSLYVFLCGPATQNNANSNTSGVATLFEIMEAMPSEYRSKVAFIFFDSSVNGLVGAADFAKKHKHLNKKLFVNFDCVGVGDFFVAAMSRGAKKFSDAAKAAFAASGKIQTEILSGAKRIPSDHNKFKCAIGVSAFEKSGSTLILKIKNDDTDTVCSDENIEYAKEAGLNLARFIFDSDAVPKKNDEPAIEEAMTETCEIKEPIEPEETSANEEAAEINETVEEEIAVNEEVSEEEIAEAEKIPEAEGETV